MSNMGAQFCDLSGLHRQAVARQTILANKLSAILLAAENLRAEVRQWRREPSPPLPSLPVATPFQPPFPATPPTAVPTLPVLSPPLLPHRPPLNPPPLTIAFDSTSGQVENLLSSLKPGVFHDFTNGIPDRAAKLGFTPKPPIWLKLTTALPTPLPPPLPPNRLRLLEGARDVEDELATWKMSSAAGPPYSLGVTGKKAEWTPPYPRPPLRPPPSPPPRTLIFGNLGYRILVLRDQKEKEETGEQKKELRDDIRQRVQPPRPPDRRRLLEVSRDTGYKLRGEGLSPYSSSTPEMKPHRGTFHGPGPRLNGPRLDGPRLHGESVVRGLFMGQPPGERPLGFNAPRYTHQSLGRGRWMGQSPWGRSMGFHEPRPPDQPLGRGTLVGQHYHVPLVGFYITIRLHSGPLTAVGREDYGPPILNMALWTRPVLRVEVLLGLHAMGLRDRGPLSSLLKKSAAAMKRCGRLLL